MRSTRTRSRGSGSPSTTRDEDAGFGRDVSFLESMGFSRTTNGRAQDPRVWNCDNDDPDDIEVGWLYARDGAVDATIGQSYDYDGQPDGGWIGRIVYDGEDGEYVEATGSGSNAEEAIADMEESLLGQLSS